MLLADKCSDPTTLPDALIVFSFLAFMFAMMWLLFKD